MMLFGKKESKRIAVISIDTRAISAGLVYLQGGKPPHVVHTVRVPLDPHATEPVLEALPRLLSLVLDTLVSTGGSLLHSIAGSASVEEVCISFSSPWQTSVVRMIDLRSDVPFVFTERKLEELVEKNKEPVAPGFTLVDDKVLSIFLNGYEIQSPFGNKASHVQAVTLTSSVHTEAHEIAHSAAKKAFHTNHIFISAFLPELYAVEREYVPAQNEYLVLDIGTDASDILLVKHGLLVDAREVDFGLRSILEAVHEAGLSSPTIPVNDSSALPGTPRTSIIEDKSEEAKKAWSLRMKEVLTEIHKEEALPYQIFCIADPSVAGFTERLIDSDELRSLWLTSSALNVHTLSSNEFLKFVTTSSNEAIALQVLILALAEDHRFQTP